MDENNTQTAPSIGRGILPCAADPGIIATAVLAWLTLRDAPAVEGRPRSRWEWQSRIRRSRLHQQLR